MRYLSVAQRLSHESRMTQDPYPNLTGCVLTVLSASRRFRKNIGMNRVQPAPLHHRARASSSTCRTRDPLPPHCYMRTVCGDFHTFVECSRRGIDKNTNAARPSPPPHDNIMAAGAAQSPVREYWITRIWDACGEFCAASHDKCFASQTSAPALGPIANFGASPVLWQLCCKINYNYERSLGLRAARHLSTVQNQTRYNPRKRAGKLDADGGGLQVLRRRHEAHSRSCC